MVTPQVGVPYSPSKSRRFDKHNVWHYLIIYLLLLSGQSYLFEYVLQGLLVPAAGVVLLIVVLNRKYWHFRSLVLLWVIFVLSLYVRIVQGGVGLDVVLSYSFRIGLLLVAINYDYTWFARRLISTITALGAISSLVYVLRLIIPSLYELLPLVPFDSQGSYYSMDLADRVSYQTKGMLFVSIREGESRNIGFYTEPGVYQAVLIGALFYLLFLRDRLRIGQREFVFEFILLTLTMVSCGSTTGYISFLILIFGYFVAQRSFALKGRVAIVLALFLMLIAVDWTIRRDKSLVHENLISKIVSPNNSFTLDQGNGGVRLDSVRASFESLVSHPMGVGFDRIMETKGELAVGAGLFITAAALGFLFLVTFLIWLLVPVFMSDIGLAAKVVYVAIYLLYAVSQALVVTPVLVSVSLYLSLECRNQTSKCTSASNPLLTHSRDEKQRKNA